MIIPKKNLSADFVVVGGGMAGICAAVAAARYAVVIGSSLPRGRCSYAAAR